MTRGRGAVGLVGVVVFGSLLLAGCGGGDEKGAAGPTTAARTPSTEHTAGGGSNSSSNGGSNGGSNGAAAVTSGSCMQAATAMAQAASGFSSAFSGTSSDLSKSVDTFEAFAAAAPSEIRADLQKVAAGYAEFVKVLSEVDFDPAAGKLPSADALAKLQAASAKFDEGDFEAAANRVTAWFDDNCGS